MHSLHDQHQRKKRDKIRKISIKSSGMTRFRRPAPSPGVSHWGKDQDHLGAGVPKNRSCYASSPETRFARPALPGDNRPMGSKIRLAP
jgi:hypothetical protein